MMAAVVAAASMVAAGMALAVVMVVMIAAYVGIVSQLPCQECLHRFVRITGNAAVNLNTGTCQRHLRATADAAANQNLRAHAAQQACQSAVAAAAGIIDLGGYDLAVLNLINLKLGGMSKMLEDFPLPISNRDFHFLYPFRMIL